MRRPMGVLARRCSVMHRPETSIEHTCQTIDLGKSRFTGSFDNQVDNYWCFFSAEKCLPASTLADEALVSCLIFPAEGHAALIHGEQTAVGNRRPRGITDSTNAAYLMLARQ